LAQKNNESGRSEMDPAKAYRRSDQERPVRTFDGPGHVWGVSEG
jgi:hypothetical protein